MPRQVNLLEGDTGQKLTSLEVLVGEALIVRGASGSRTTASFVQPAIDATVQVAVNDSSPFVVASSVAVVGGGLYTVTSVDDATHVTLNNIGTDSNANPSTVIAAGRPVVPGIGLEFRFTFPSAGTFTRRWPISATPWLAAWVRAASSGGAGGGGGGGSFVAATTGGGGGGGRGGGAGQNCASRYIPPVNPVEPGEVLTAELGAGGAGGGGGKAGVAGGAGTAGTGGTPGGNTSLKGSVSGLLFETPSLSFAAPTGGGGGNPGAVTAGGTAGAAAANGSTWGPGTTNSAPVAAGAGGAATAGASGAKSTARGQWLQYAYPATTAIFGLAVQSNGGTGNGSNRGGGGGGGPGADGAAGDMAPIDGVSIGALNGLGGKGGDGGAAETNAGGAAGSDGTDGVNGQGGGGGGGGGGGCAVGGLAGFAGGKGGKGCDARMQLIGVMAQ